MSHWITPPDFYEKLNDEFNFDFDPCPFPRPDGYNSLILPWGLTNYVNPPFNKKDAPFGGPSAFVRKAIAERNDGCTSVFVLPLPWNLGLLMAAGAETARPTESFLANANATRRSGACPAGFGTPSETTDRLRLGLPRKPRSRTKPKRGGCSLPSSAVLRSTSENRTRRKEKV